MNINKLPITFKSSQDMIKFLKDKFNYKYISKPNTTFRDLEESHIRDILSSSEKNPYVITNVFKNPKHDLGQVVLDNFVKNTNINFRKVA